MKKEEEKCNESLKDNLDNEQDKETDDILTKLGNLSQTSDDKSFDSPIIFNRTKSYFHVYNTESRQLLYDSLIMNDKNISNNELNNTTYISRTRSVKREPRAKSFANIKKNNSIKNKKFINYKKNLERNTFVKIPEIVRNNSCSDFKFNFNNYNNNKYSNLENINENIDNKINENKIGIINNKLDNIFSIIKNMKQIDKILKKKDIKKIETNFLSLKNEVNINSTVYDSINELLDYIILLLNSVQNNNVKNNNNKVGNEKIILKLQNEIKEKEKEIGELINKTNLEKEKLENNYKLNNTEILNLRKQNKELTNKLFNVQKHISKLETNNETLEQKINTLILEKTNKTINSSTSLRSTFICPGYPKIDQVSLDTSYISQKISNENKNSNQKINDKYNISKKLNLNLIDLLKEINNMLCYYDTFLNKEFCLNKNQQNLAKNLNSFMDINGLMEDKKMKMFSNEYMRNLEIIFNKVEEFVKDINGNNSEIKNNLTIKHSSTKIIPKKDKIIKENENALISRNNKISNMTKNLKNSNTNNMNIPTRKRTKTINNA